MWNDYTQPFRITLVGKMFCKTLAQLARIVADNVVLDGAVARTAVKYVYTNLVFAYLFLASLNGLSYHKKQKLRQQGGPAKVWPGDNAFG